MRTDFFKYQGTGNDFVIIDNRNGHDITLTTELVKKLCNRKFGIGADGLMTLNDKPVHLFLNAETFGKFYKAAASIATHASFFAIRIVIHHFKVITRFVIKGH